MPSQPTQLLLVYSKGKHITHFVEGYLLIMRLTQISFTTVIHWDGTSSIERVKFSGRILFGSKGYQ